MFRKFIGNKQFYKNLLLISIPIILSQLITQFVSLLDNLMVGQLTTAEFDGVDRKQRGDHGKERSGESHCQ